MEFDPTRKTYTMRQLKRLVAAVGGTWRMNGRTGLLFDHPLMPRHCIVRANRDDASRHLMTWVRHLYADLETLREAFGIEKER